MGKVPIEKCPSRRKDGGPRSTGGGLETIKPIPLWRNKCKRCLESAETNGVGQATSKKFLCVKISLPPKKGRVPPLISTIAFFRLRLSGSGPAPARLRSISGSGPAPARLRPISGSGPAPARLRPVSGSFSGSGSGTAPARLRLGSGPEGLCNQD